ncbi:MAG: FHA domain-containing protein [Nannocystaceae bacterium]
METRVLDSAPVLIECSGPRKGREHPLGPGVQVIGRGDGASVRLSGVDVSRRHVRLDVDFDGVYLSDLGSKNGVYVHGRRVDSDEGRTKLDDGDEIDLGGIVLRLDHPGSRVAQALADAGEITITRRRPVSRIVQQPSLAIPVLVAAAFAALVYALLA